MKTFRLFVAITLICFALSPVAYAVVPPPDGGYPGFSTAEGQNALFNLTTGVANTANGWYSLFSDTEGSFNTAVGAGTLVFNIGDPKGAGSQNTAIGAVALLNNINGDSNTAVGVQALQNNTDGVLNTAVGVLTLQSNIGDRNTAAGGFAMFHNTTGGYNTAIGRQALAFTTTGNFNIGVGNDSGSGISTADDVICIGAGIPGANVSHSCYIGNIWQQSGGSQAVYVNSIGKLGQLVSSRRFKDNIKPMAHASEIIYCLKPVSFRYKSEIEPTRALGFGLIAEDVEKINPELVTRGNDGRAASVRYDAVNAMLLNEFLKEHRAFVEQQQKVEEQGATIAQQQKQIEALTAGLQKVNAQLEMNNSAPQVAKNN